MVVLFAVLWILSPAVLVVVLILLNNKNKRMRDFISQLYSSGRISDKERNDLNINQSYYPNMPPFMPSDYSGILQNMPPVDSTPAPFIPVDHSDISQELPCISSAPTPFDASLQNGIPQNFPYINNQPMPFVQHSVPAFDNTQHCAQNTTEKKEKISSISVVLMIGVVFVMLAGVIFAKTSWVNLTDFARIITLSSFGMVFFGASAFAQKKLKLHRTGMAFFALGSVFLPISITASGLLGLFGNYMSVSGDGAMLSYSFGFLVLSVASIIGAYIYKSRPYAVVFLSSVTLFLSTLLISFLNYDAVSLFMSLYSLALVAAAKKLSGKNEVFAPVLAPFALVCSFLLSTLTIPDSTVLSGFSAFAFAFVFLMPIFSEKLKGASTIPVTIFLYIGAFRMLDSFEQTSVFALALVGVMLTLLAVFGGFDESTAKIYGVFAVCAAFLHIIVTLIMTCAFSCNNILQPITTFIVLAIIFICADIKKDVLLRSCMPAQSTLAIVQFISYFTDFSDNGYLVMLYLLIAQFVFFALVKRVRTPFSDVLCLLILPVFEFAYSLTGDQNGSIAAISIIAFVAIPLLYVFNIVRREYSKIPAIISAVFFPAVTALSALFVHIFNDMKYIEVHCISALVFAFACIVIFSHKPNEPHRLIAGMITALASFTGAFCMVFDNCASYIAYFVVVLIFAYLFYVYQKQNNRIISMLSFYAFGLSLVAAVCTITYIHCSNNHVEYALALTAVVALAFAAVYVYFSKSTTSGAAFESLKIFSLSFVPVFALIYSCSITSQFVWQLALCTLVCIVALYLSQTWVFAVIGGLSFYVSLDLWLELIDFDDACIYLFIGVIFAVFSAVSIAFKKCGKSWFSTISRCMTLGIPLLIVFTNRFHHVGIIEYTQFFFLLFSSAIPLLYCDFSQKSQKTFVLESVGAITLMLCIIQQPFIDFEGTFFEGKLYLVPIILAAFALKHIWYEGSFMHQNALFVAGVWSIVSLSFSAMASNSLSDAFLILSISLIMLIISFMFRRKKWFLLSAATLVLLSVYLSNKFDLRFGWWVYLLIAGIILIAIAAFNEYCKTKGESLKDKAGRFWQDWTW